jgi:hypothetical protein
MLALVDGKHLDLQKVKCFVLDECDKMLEALGTGASPAASRARARTVSHPLHTRRHASRRAAHLQGDAAREASDDVLRHALRRDPARVQEVHA